MHHHKQYFSLLPILIIGIIWIGFAGWYVHLIFQLADAYQSRMTTIGTMPVEKPEERANAELYKLRNPLTGTIPENITRRERLFAGTLPKKEQQRFSKHGSVIQANAWTHRGPYTIAGRTRAFGIDEANEQVLIAGGISGGLWRSENGGRSWLRVALESLPNVSCLAQDTRPGKTNIWYAGTGEGIGNSASITNAPFRGDGLYKSLDNGKSWTLLESTSTKTPQQYDQRFDYTWNLAINPTNFAQDEVYAACFAAIKRSIDGGKTWATVLGTDNLAVNGRYTDVAVAPRSGVRYATISRDPTTNDGTEIPRGIFRSVDGVTWTLITPPDFPLWFRRITIAVSPSNENVVYFLAETPNTGFMGKYGADNEWHSLWKYTYRSGNGTGSGGAWEDRSANLPSFGSGTEQGDYVSQESFDMVIKVKPNDENIVFIGGTNLYRSDDAFATRSKVLWIGGYSEKGSFAPYSGHYVDQHVLSFPRNNPDVLYTANDGGIFCTDDNRRNQPIWTSLNNGYLTTQFYTLAIDTQQPQSQLIMGGLQDNGTHITSSNQSQKPWLYALSGDGSYCAVIDKTTFVCSAQNAQLYRVRTNADNTRLLSTTSLQPPGTDFSFVNPFIPDPNNPSILYVPVKTSLLRLNNLNAIPDGASSASAQWTTLSNILTENISALSAMSGKSGTELLAGTSTGKLYRINNVQTGTKPTIQEMTGSGFPRGGYIHCISIHPIQSEKILVVFSNYEVQSLWYSENAGQSWMPVGGNLEQQPDGSGAGPSCRWATILSDGTNTGVFVATSAGLYSTSRLNGAQTVWMQEASSLIGNAVVSMVVGRSSDGFVAAATHGNGVISATVNLGDGIIPQYVVLSQNYPNPFSDNTTLNFTLPEQTFVQMSVYDATGRFVTQITNRIYDAGIHTIQWNARHQSGLPVAEGAYTIKMQTWLNGSRQQGTATVQVRR